jgi:3-hydroxymyristoyl/3-hydroxydecanoyl-(acyl carrier protein) dehydratase
MIIQHYDFAVRAGGEPVYDGETYFGFFTSAALAQQVGIREARPFVPTEAGRSFLYPSGLPFPDRSLRMVDRIEAYLPQGGPHGLGFIQGCKDIDPAEWFFAAHFYQDPVWPGSLGLEAFLQLLLVAVVERFGRQERDIFTLALGKPHRWLYRGQVVPGNKRVTVQAAITRADEQAVTADGYLLVDGLVIYQMNDFTLAGETGTR